MKLLLDTHVFLWMNNSPEKLSTGFRERCEQAQDDLYLSLVTPWEMQIKQQIGKLKIASPIAEMLEKNQQINRMQLLPITLKHILALDQLPLHHGDPFDRLLIAQAMVEDIALVTADEKIRRYDVEVVW
jgi:PIN domain nuclease of toxin-antitoxin system